MKTISQGCSVCKRPIRKADDINQHHPIYRSNGGSGTPTEMLHRDCHLAIHSEDFRVWGRIGGQISSLSKQWAFNLNNVRDDPYYQPHRDFYTANYSH